MKNKNITQPLQWGDPLNALLRVAIYVRKSTATEGRSHSREEQLERCLQDAKYAGFSQENITVFEEPEGQKGNWFWDDERGRFDKPFRPELTRMMLAVEAGSLDIVMAYKADRLFRDNGVADALMKRFVDLGVRLYCGGRDLEIHSARGLCNASVDGAVARQWRDQISEDIRRDHLYKAKRGMFSRNPSCFGFRSNGRGTQTVRAVEAELATVRRIFQMFVAGENGSGPMGITRIASVLMDEGVQVAVGAKNHTAKHPETVHTSQIRTILTNCMYVGRWRHLGDEYPCDRLLLPGGAEPSTVVPVQLFEEAQQKLARSFVPGKKSLGSTHSLTGIVVCGQCGRPMTVQHRKRGDGSDRCQFICKHTHGSRPCNREGTRIVQEEVVDAWVLEHLMPLIAAELEQVNAAVGRDETLARKAELERKLVLHQRRESEELTRILGVLDANQVAGIAAKLREERRLIEEKLDEISSQLLSSSTPSPSELRNLDDLPKAAVKDAVRRAFLWIALCTEGVVAMTTWGTRMGARYIDRNLSVLRCAENRRRPEPPNPVAAIECINWFVDAEEFVRGIRESQPGTTRTLADNEILPARLRESA